MRIIEMSARIVIKKNDIIETPQYGEELPRLKPKSHRNEEKEPGRGRVGLS